MAQRLFHSMLEALRRRQEAWQDRWPERILLLVAGVMATLVVGYFVTLPVPLRWQLLASAALLFVASVISSRLPQLRLYLVILSVAFSLRYLWWRTFNTLEFVRIPDAILGYTLFIAEFYGIVILMLGYFQTLEPLQRRPVPLPRNLDKLPWVDVFIPTYNEEPEIVGRTAGGALMMDYPKKRVYILDDKRRPAMRAMAERLGCHYMIRGDNKHAKAGNINAALARTNGELVAIFDADHVPVRSFLQLTVGFFLKNNRLALVQTPHHFFNPDPFQRNLLIQGKVPAEQELFYHVILPGDDFWNSAFFCGSCAVLRRSALMEVGGIAQETVTEDAHTALKLHSRGWDSAYLAIPQAAGLATERYAFHVMQRIRWAQGMVQIFRLDNPLIKAGLSWPQRINYLNAMMHFLFGLPRLVYVVAPLTYLLFGARPVSANPLELVAYAVPHIALAGITNSLTFGNFRHSFWAEVYEMAIAWQTGKVTLITLFSPSNKKFNVTTKGEGLLEDPEFDWRNAVPNLVLTGLSLLALLVAPLRYLGAQEELLTILVNSFWTVFNLIILSSALLVAREQRQTRRSYRVERSLPAELILHNGASLEASTLDISEGGCRLQVAGASGNLQASRVRILGAGGDVFETGARVVHQRDNAGVATLGLCFGSLEDAEQRTLNRIIYGAADAWLGFEQRPDRFVRGFWEVARTPWIVGFAAYRDRKRRRSMKRLGSPSVDQPGASG